MKKIWPALLLLILTPPLAGAEEAPVKLSMEQAVAAALENNLGLRLKKQEVATAQGTMEIAQGAFDPLASLGGFYGDSRGLNFTTGFNGELQSSGWSASVKKQVDTGTAIDLTWENQRYASELNFFTPNPAYSSSLSLGVTQPLLKGWGREIQTARVLAAEKLVAASGRELSGEAVDLGSSVATAYWELLFAHQNLEVNKLSLTLAEKFLDNTTQKIEAGVLAPVEIYQPQAEVARREQALIEGERAVALAEDGLKLLLNRQDWDTRLLPADRPVVGESRAVLPEVIDQALASRPDIQAGERRIEASELAVRLADDGVRPSLDLSGRLGLVGLDDSYGGSLDEVTTSSDVNWQVGLTFTIPLGNRAAKGSLLAAQADLEKARTAVALLRQEVIQKAREAVRNEQLALKNIEASRKTALALQKSLEAEENKFEVGLATTLNVLEAQEAYARGLIGEKRALIDYALARVELNRVQGVIMAE